MESDDEKQPFRLHVREICNGVLDGKIEVFPGLKKLFGPLPVLIPVDDPVANAMLTIDRQTRHIVVGNERKQWNMGELIIRNQDYVQSSDKYREEILEICRNLLHRFS